MSKFACLVAALACLHVADGEAININGPTVITMPTSGSSITYGPSSACILKSCDGAYGLYFDGHLKLFKHDSNGNKVTPPVWMDSNPNTVTQLGLQTDFNICLYNGWCAFTHDYNCPASKGARTLQLTSSGQLQVLASDGTVIWMTPTPTPGTTQNRFSTVCCLDGVHNKGCTFQGTE